MKNSLKKISRYYLAYRQWAFQAYDGAGYHRKYCQLILVITPIIAVIFLILVKIFGAERLPVFFAVLGLIAAFDAWGAARYRGKFLEGWIRGILIFSFYVTVAFVLAGPGRTFFLRDACLDEGGKWASNGDRCIYKNCAETKSCVPSYRNNQICSSLKMGISQEELYFQLGMAESKTGSVYIFTGGGGGSPIRAVLEEGKLTKLDCGI